MEPITLPLDGREEVMVTMRTAGVIRGRVVDDKTGKPLSQFTVAVTTSPDSTPNDPPAVGAAHHDEKFAPRDGTFQIGDFVRGEATQVTVNAWGYFHAVVRRVVAVADSDAKAVEFRLTPIESDSGDTSPPAKIDGGTVPGKASATEGSPARDASAGNEKSWRS